MKSAMTTLAIRHSNRKSMAKRRQEHRAAGLCSECAERAEPGKKRCRVHLERQSAATTASRKRKRDRGLCAGSCGEPSDTFLCADCCATEELKRAHRELGSGRAA